jgi:argininosuccinate lyase
MQEDKQPMFDAIETTGDSLEMMALILRETTFNIERMESAASGELMATEIADYLVREKGVPFREAHHITGTIVSFAEQQGKNLDKLSLDDYRKFSEHFALDIFEYLDPHKSLIEKRSAGSTNPNMVREAIRKWRA